MVTPGASRSFAPPPTSATPLHLLELVEHDSIKSTNKINHTQMFLEKLYSVYHQP